MRGEIFLGQTSDCPPRIWQPIPVRLPAMFLLSPADLVFLTFARSSLHWTSFENAFGSTSLFSYSRGTVPRFVLFSMQPPCQPKNRPFSPTPQKVCLKTAAFCHFRENSPDIPRRKVTKLAAGSEKCARGIGFSGTLCRVARASVLPLLDTPCVSLCPTRVWGYSSPLQGACQPPSVKHCYVLLQKKKSEYSLLKSAYPYSLVGYKVTMGGGRLLEERKVGEMSTIPGKGLRWRSGEISPRELPM